MWPTVISCFQVEAIHIIIIITSKREREKGYTSKEIRRIFLESKKKYMCVRVWTSLLVKNNTDCSVTTTSG